MYETQINRNEFILATDFSSNVNVKYVNYCVILEIRVFFFVRCCTLQRAKQFLAPRE